MDASYRVIWGDDCASAGSQATCTLSNVQRDMVVSAQVQAITALAVGTTSPSAAGVVVPFDLTLSTPLATSTAANISVCANATTTDASCTGGTLLCEAPLPAGSSTATCSAVLAAGSSSQVTAYYPGGTDHVPAAAPAVRHEVGQFAQTIAFTSTAPVGAQAGGTYTVAATGGTSGNPVVFAVDAGSAAVCSISGSVVTFTASGNCLIHATQAGSSSHAVATPALQSVAVGLVPQTIAFTSTAPVGAQAGGTYTVAATGGASGNPVVFAVDAGSAAVCGISGSVVTFTASGSCLIQATQAGSSSHAVATPASQSVAVGLVPQTITFTSTAPVGAQAGDTYTVAATGGTSGKPVVFSVDAGSAAVCGISGSVVTFTAPGNCVIQATQAGDGTTHADAQLASQTVLVGMGSFQPQVASNPNPSVSREEVTFTVSLNATGGVSKTVAVPTGTVELLVEGQSLGSATLLNGAATLRTTQLVQVGSQSVVMNYSGDANYQAVQGAVVHTHVVLSAQVMPVPALHTLGLAVLGLLAAGAGAAGLRKRRCRAGALG